MRRTGRIRARVSASSPASASTRDGNSGSEGGGAGTDGAWATGSGGPDGALPFMSLRSGSQIAKRRMEVDGAAGPPGSSGGGQVHDGMLHRGAGTPTKRRRSIFVGGVETEYVADSESDSDEGCVMLGLDGVKMPVAQVQSGPSGVKVELNAAAAGLDGVKMPMAQVHSGPSGVKVELNANAAAMNMDTIDVVGARGGPARGSNGEPTYNHEWKEIVAGVIEQLAYPAGSASSPETEMFADMYVKEELGQYNPRKEGNVREKLVLGNNNSRADADVGSRVGTSSHRFDTDSKGKGKMVVEDSLSSLSSSEDESDSEPVNYKERVVEDSASSLKQSEDELDSKPVDSKEIQNNSGPASASASVEPLRRKEARERAIRLAPKFAFFKADKDEHSEDDEEEELEPAAAPQDWPGPFATASRIYEEREAKLRARELNSSKVNESANKASLWSPSKDKRNPFPARAAPSLTSLCLNTLAEHSEGIVSLGGIPEELKHKLLKILCHSRKMNTHLLNELMCDSPTELHLSECSWLSDDDFEKTFGKCNTDSLQVLLFLRFMHFLCYGYFVYTF